jgi:hypothetical protein
MSRELRALTGRSPRELLDGASSTLALSDFFKTEATPAPIEGTSNAARRPTWSSGSAW